MFFPSISCNNVTIAMFIMSLLEMSPDDTVLGNSFIAKPVVATYVCEYSPQVRLRAEHEVQKLFEFLREESLRDPILVFLPKTIHIAIYYHPVEAASLGCLLKRLLASPHKEEKYGTSE
jgi:hypothetical protein